MHDDSFFFFLDAFFPLWSGLHFWMHIATTLCAVLCRGGGCVTDEMYCAGQVGQPKWGGEWVRSGCWQKWRGCGVRLSGARRGARVPPSPPPCTGCNRAGGGEREACRVRARAGKTAGERRAGRRSPQRAGCRSPWLGEGCDVGVRWEGAAGGACHVIWRVCWERKEGRAESWELSRCSRRRRERWGGGSLCAPAAGQLQGPLGGVP